MNARRSTVALVATAMIGLASAPAAVAEGSPSPSPSAKLPSGLFGDGDPAFDGVWRQSLALLAQDTVKLKPATKAVDWLTGQQCTSGGFAPFRADPTEPCDSGTKVDSNQTAAAVQALAALGGHDKTVDKAVTWLKSVQNQDGGWGYAPGGPTDTNSTSVVIGALAAAGEKPSEVTSQKGKSPQDALLTLSVDCEAEGGGAFAYQPDKKGTLAANDDATASGVLGGLGKGFVVTAGEQRDTAPCAEAKTAGRAAQNGAGHLAGALAKNGHLMSALAGSEDQPDVGNTADAVVSLSAAGLTEQTKKPLAWLEKNGPAWAKTAGPSAYAQLIFTAHAAGADPRAFGGTDLVKELGATGPAAQDSAQDEKKDDGGEPVNVWWMIAVGVFMGAGIGFLLSMRNKNKQLS